MAKATKHSINTYSVTLTLTSEEAETFYGITSRIGGSGDGRRGHMERIGRALYNAGVREGFSESEVSPTNRAIYFL
jgi:hypothetical protein